MPPVHTSLPECIADVNTKGRDVKDVIEIGCTGFRVTEGKQDTEKH